jgi:hypothetical protein
MPRHVPTQGPPRSLVGTSPPRRQHRNEATTGLLRGYYESYLSILTDSPDIHLPSSERITGISCQIRPGAHTTHRMLALYLCGGLAASPRVRDALTPHERLDQATAKEGGPLAGKCKALQEGITDEWCETNYAGFPKFCKCKGVVALDPADVAKAAADDAKAAAKAAADANTAAAVPTEGEPLPATPPQAGGATGSVQQPAPVDDNVLPPVSAQQPAPEAPVSAQPPTPVAVPVATVPQAAPVAEPAAAAVSAVPEVTIGSNDADAAATAEKQSYCGSVEMDEYFNKKCGNSVVSIIAECCDDHTDDAKCDSFRMACIKGHIDSGECKDPFDCDDGCQFYDGVASTCCPHVRARKLAVAPTKAVDWATGAELPQATSAQYDAPLDEVAMKKAIAKAQAVNQAAAQAEAQAAPAAAVDPAAEARAAAHDAAQANAQAAAAAKKANSQASAAAGSKAGEPAKAVDWATGKELPQAPTAQYDAPLDEAAMRDSIAAAEAANAAASDSVAANIPVVPQPQQNEEDTAAEFDPRDEEGAPQQRPAPTQTPDDYCGSPAHAAHFDELCGGKLLDIMADCCTQECIYHWKCAKKCDAHRAACSQAQVQMGVCTDKNDCDMGTQVFNQVTDSCCTRLPPPVPPPSAPPPYRVCERHDRKKDEDRRREGREGGRLEAAPFLS